MDDVSTSVAASDPWAKFRKPPVNAAPPPAPLPDPKTDPWAKFRTPPGTSLPTFSGHGAAIGAEVGARVPIEALPQPAPSAMGEAKGLAGSAARGVIGLAGTPGAIADAWDKVETLPSRGIAYAADKLGLLPAGKHYQDMVEAAKGLEKGYDNPISLPTPERIQKGVESFTGPLPEPQSKGGKLAGAAIEFGPQALFGGGRSIPQITGRLLKYAVTPGVTSELAGQYMHGSKYEPVARAVGALAGGVGAASVSRESAAANAITKAFEHIPAQDRTRYIVGAQRLMTDAQREGVGLTWPEALKQASGGRVDMTGAQRVVEGTGRLSPFMGERPGQVDAATQRHLNAISPPTDQPSTIGPAVGEAATRHLVGVRADIGNATRPIYRQVERTDVGPVVSQALASDARYAAALHQVRGDPFLNAGIEHLPDSSGAVIDRVNKRLGEIQSDATNPVGTQGQSALRAMNAGTAQQTPEQVLNMASGGAYQHAQVTQAQLRQQYLDPLLAGPLGKMQKNDLTTNQAVEALFGNEARSGREVGESIAALHARNPWAARQVVRAYVEGVFNGAHKVAGGDQFVGARLANTLRANPNMAERLASAVNALPNGAAISPGFSRFLDIMEATGQRPRPNSATSFNTEFMHEMKTNAGGVPGAAAAATKQVAGIGFKWPAAVAKKFEQWSMGRNLDQLADLMVNPEAGRRFQELANMPLGSGKSLAVAGRLAAIAGQGIRHRTDQSTQ